MPDIPRNGQFRVLVPVPSTPRVMVQQTIARFQRNNRGGFLEYRLDSPVYLTGSPELPVGTPYGFPHLMDNTDALLRAVERSEVHLHAADGIATTLYNHSPATLRAFLDLSKHDFTFQHQERVEGSSRFDLLIRREGRTLTAGFYKDKPEGRYWDFQYVYDIEDSGKWSPVSGKARGAVLMVSDDEDRELEGELTVGGCGRYFASAIIMRELWKDGEGATVSVSF